jgi:hypothetical protein
MLEAGAHGFVEKTAGFKEFKKGLATIALGGTYFGPAIASVLRNVVANPESGGSPDFLTEREREILQLVAEGPQHEGDRLQARDKRQDRRQPPHKPDAQAQHPRRRQPHPPRHRDRACLRTRAS